MNFFEILLIALSMSMDAFAVCLGVGAARRGDGRRSTFRLAFHFGLFQFIMPVIGWLLGMTIEPLIRNYADWIAFGLLTFIGVRMIYSSVFGGEAQRSNDPSRGWNLVLLSIAVSMDALAIGLSLGVLGIFVW